ncbi:LysR family transcriptional regulator [Devosia sp. SL43]|jgi:LysR family nod box-dependent transcriptional activator|uniref:LysR family transcriptional regulator n=1 Tax=Devosia sp. SL43 TaxID=2806348 RepID=UPI001F42E3D3|nr:LysR family transcriptional regulator [Devosia sp. SL43]UJW85685.1 LysR family transcriptional regulator [Devosia sp. SL43]
MRFRKLDLNLLVALDHMLELRSVSEAADKMFMSQSAMSNALTRIRTYFDDPLLIQVGRRMELTPRAEALRPAIRDILVRVDATIDVQPEFRADQSTRTFNVLLSDYTMRVLMPEVLALVEEARGTVKFNLLPQTVVPYTLLERGELDFLISPEQLISRDHPSLLLYEDEYVVVADKNGPYGGAPIDLEAYQVASHVVMVPPGNAMSVESTLVELAGISRNVDVTTFSFSSIPYLIAGTSRIATVHRRLARLIGMQVPIVHYPLPFAADPLRQMLQWHAYRELDQGILWLRSIFEEASRRLDIHSPHQ